MGILRSQPDDYYMNLNREDILHELSSIEVHLNFVDMESETDILRNKLIKSHRTRYLSLWSDHSDLQAHGYMLYEVNCLYNREFFLTNAEYEQKFGKFMDIVSFVQKPSIYMLAQLGDTIDEQKILNEIRIKDLKALSTAIEDITDVLRFQKGDHPQLQVEFGVSVGGNNCCVSCEANVANFEDIASTVRQKIRTVENSQNICLQGVYSCKPGTRIPTRDLKKAELQQELNARNLPTLGLKVPELRDALKDVKNGIESVPLVLLHTPDSTLKAVGLDRIEAAPLDPLHTSKGHIANVFCELKVHAKYGNDIKEFEEAVFGNKSMLRGRDYRDALGKLAVFVRTREMDEDVCRMVTSLNEIIHMMYLTPLLRNASFVLRLTNQVFIHHLSVKAVMPEIKSMSKRRFYGQYFHDLCHLPLVCRVIAPSSLHCELEEADFHHCKVISERTSSHKINHIIPNILLRMQVESKSRQPQVSHVSNLDLHMENSIMKSSWLIKFPNIMQAHAECLADFLHCGKGAWWDITESGDVQYFDSMDPENTSPDHPKLRSFSTFDLHKEKQILDKTWTALIPRIKTGQIAIPLKKVKVYQGQNIDEVIVLKNFKVIENISFHPPFYYGSFELILFLGLLF